MKFELVEPPQDLGGGDAHLPPKHHPTTPGPAPAPGAHEWAGGQDDPRPGPVNVRMSSQIEGVRSSLELLRAHAAEQAMAETGHTNFTAADTEPGAEFCAHRFTGRTRDGGR